MERVLSARRQLEIIACWAEASRCRPVVLKGGLSVLEADAIDLNDVDLLLPIEDARRLHTWLIERGHRVSGFPSAEHFRAVMQAGELPIEIHFALDGQAAGTQSPWWRRIREVPTAPGLWRLAPADHLWHVLEHQVDKHVSRRGRVRDLLLLQNALASCSPEDIDVTKDRAARHPQSRIFDIALDHVMRWSSGRAWDDPFAELALAGYLLARRRENRVKVHPTSGLTNRWIYAMLTGREELRSVRADIWAPRADVSGFAPLRRVQVVSPLLGRIVQLGGRVVRFTASYLRAYPVARSIRRRVPRYRRVVESVTDTW